MCMDKHRLLGGHCELSDKICMYYVYPSIMEVFTIIMIMRMITNITNITIITVITNITIILYHHHIAWVATTGHGSGRLVLSDVRPHNCTQSFFIEIITIVIMIIIKS